VSQVVHETFDTLKIFSLIVLMLKLRLVVIYSCFNSAK